MIKTLYGLSRESPSGLVYLVDVYSGNGKLEKSAGMAAGNIASNGRWQVSVDGVQVQAHRVVWELSNGGIPDGMFVDHIDGDFLNNSIENLRVVDHSTNMKNKSRYCSNKTGITGVFLDSKGNYVAAWYEGGQKKRKSFSVAKYGTQHALNLAVECRDFHIKLDSNYTGRHGG